MLLNSKQITESTGGSYIVEPMDASELACGLTWDSREVEPGFIYVALPGARVDGHSFVDDAIVAGARIVLVMQPISQKTAALAKEFGAAVIEVANTFSAITDVARAWRKHLNAIVIALSGSSGKTTTKNLIAQVLAAKYKVVATKANQNNELGVPKTLLNANPDTEYVVVEMGMRGMHQIESLSNFVCQDMGLIVNVGESHIELLGGRENIARAKAEILEALPAGTGCAFINEADDYAEFVGNIARLEERNIERIYFGSVYEGANEPENKNFAKGCKRVWAQDVCLDEQGQPEFLLCASGFEHAADVGQDSIVEEENATEQAPVHAKCHLNLRGMHNASNATAAAAVGLKCGMTLEEIASALCNAQPESGRQEFLHARGGFTVINDAYNANPESMRASLVMFDALKVRGRRVAVLGDMGELGDYALPCHQGIGRFAAGLHLDLLICVGKLANAYFEAAREAGMPEDKLMYVQTTSEVLGILDTYLEPNDAVLVKASHFMELDRVVEGLLS
jgi:UDP-N-acetylmuramoyl-tripeptide--D-alanyl-D-alanine ligase